MNFFSNLSYFSLAILSGLFAFSLTCLGSAIVFLFKGINKLIMDCMLALSAGIMLSSSFFSLIIPAIEYKSSFGIIYIFLLIISFLLGGLFLYFFNLIINKFFSFKSDFNFRKCLLLFFSITLHNIPEGLILGVAFGSVYHSSTSLLSAIILTIGISLQNFPEGSAISLPMKRMGVSSIKAFLFGVISGIVEPIAAIIGALLILKVRNLLPFIMLFTAGAMIYVIIVELIPESQKNKNEGLIAFINIIGFTIMMFLELLFR